MQLTAAGAAPAKDDGGEIRDGEQNAKQLLVGASEGVNNYKMNLTQAVTDWVTPRHHHNFDQLRLLVDGEFVYNKDKVLSKGWVGYFPEGVWYDQVRKKDSLLLLCQFGGASGGGYMSRQRRKAAITEMRKTGSFENGMYVFYDESGKRHQRDSFDAMWEIAMGEKLTIPEPRYSDVIAMNPENYAWVAQPGAPGVEVKWLASFTERQLRVGFFHLAAGASCDFGLHKAPEMLFLTEGSVICQNNRYEKHSAFGFEANEGSVQITASAPSEIFCIQLHQF